MDIMIKKYVLAKDLVIPAGTLFTSIPPGTRTTFISDDHIDAVIGLTDNTSGTISYGLDDSIADDEMDKLKEYFIELKD